MPKIAKQFIKGQEVRFDITIVGVIEDHKKHNKSEHKERGIKKGGDSDDNIPTPEMIVKKHLKKYGRGPFVVDGVREISQGGCTCGKIHPNEKCPYGMKSLRDISLHHQFLRLKSRNGKIIGECEWSGYYFEAV